MAMSAEFEHPDHNIPTKSAEVLFAEGKYGDAYPARLEEALSELVTESRLQGFMATRINSDDDREGIDYWLYAENYKYPFQISGTHGSGRGTKNKRRHNRGRKGSFKTQFLTERGIARVYIRKSNEKRLKNVAVLKELVLMKLNDANTKRYPI